MSEVGGLVTLHIYCDTEYPKCPLFGEPMDMYERTLSECRAEARRRGWRMSRKETESGTPHWLCPTCASDPPSNLPSTDSSPGGETDG